MYSTKLVNKNMVDGNAYITVGDPFVTQNPNPFRAGKKGEKLAPLHVKMFPPNAENGNFAKITYMSDGYKETNKYIDTQPLDKRNKGFGTKDAHRRDEFSNTIRTEQYRESIKKEKHLMASKAGDVKAKLTQLLSERTMREQELNKTESESGLFSYNNRVAQFDIGRERITSFDPKSTKDTYYKFNDERPKRFGDVPKPVSYNIGDNAWEVTYKPPSFGGKSEVRNFFDKSHLRVGN